jgi:hypothetical protein
MASWQTEQVGLQWALDEAGSSAQPRLKIRASEFRECNMETITHSQVQQLVGQLPAKKLPIAYRLLVDLSAREMDSASLQQDFMLLSIAERRRLLAEQADQMLAHYEETALERHEWQAGDFVEH